MSIVPLVNKDLDIDASGIFDSQGLGLGDIVFEFAGLGWHMDRYDFAAALAVITPTGEFDEMKPASLGPWLLERYVDSWCYGIF